jgi:transcription elongation GreA/GreB family factor
MTPMDKNHVFQAVKKKLDEQLQLLIAAAMEAREYSTAEDSKAENKYDTRGLEASYLASGQSLRAQKLREQIFRLENMNLSDLGKPSQVVVGTLVQVLVDDSLSKHFFILPVGGVDVEVEGVKFQTITIESPVGKILLGQKQGDEFEWNGKNYLIEDLR